MYMFQQKISTSMFTVFIHRYRYKKNLQNN